MQHVVTAGYVTVETAVPGGGPGGGRAHVDIPRGQVLPDDVPAEQVGVLLDRGDVAPVTAVGGPAAAVEVVAGPPAPAPGAADGTIADVLVRVGDDPAAARAALDAERAKPKPRSTLLAALTQIIEAGSPVE